MKEGLVEAMSEDLAAETLREKGYDIISLSSTLVSGSSGVHIFNRITAKDIVIFARQFAVMISANVSMVQSLKILTEQTVNIKLKIIISEMADEIDGGEKLSECLAKRPKVFSDFFVNIVKSGEASGKLDEVLNYLADETEKDYDMASKIKGAMMYPAFVMLGLLIVGIVMMVYVVPKLMEILIESGIELPLTTKILIAVSGFFVKYWLVVIIAPILLLILTKLYIARPDGRRMIDLLMLRLPIFGKLLRIIYLIRFCRSMNTLIISGIPISKSLKIAGDVVSNQVYKDLIEKTVRQVEEGNSISSIFSTSKEIPKMVSQMLNIGEKTGRLDIILGRLASFYTREANNIIANLMTLMEPIIMVIIGIAVGIMVAAIILPMYSMSSQV